jgi:hypothetical protein
MLGLRSPRSTRPSRFTRPLFLEILEDRNSPSTLTIGVAYGTGKTITLSGDLTGAINSATQRVVISGMALGSVATDANGHYSLTTQGLALGPVRAQTADGQSNIATVTLTDVAPVITFTAVESTGNVWILSGHVNYRTKPEGFTVFFGGAPVSLSAQTATVNEDGDFSVAVQLNGAPTDNGAASAYTISPWGTQSNIDTEVIYQTGT